MKSHTITNYKVIAILLCSGMTLITGCSDFLSPNAESIYTTSSFYQSEADFQYAINGVYSQQMDIFKGQDGLLHFLVARSDNSNSVNTNLYDDGGAGFTDNSSCGPTTLAWKRMYVMIDRCNRILMRIDDVTFGDSSLKNAIKGEAYALRGWAYENLGKLFGGVPLIINKEVSADEAKQIARSSQSETFAQAISDYKAAIELLPTIWEESTNAGRVTQYAVDAALGRLYMFMGDAASAKTYLEMVINSGLYEMAPDFMDAFNDAYDNNPKYDRVWEVNYIGGGLGYGQDWCDMQMPENCGISEGYAYSGSSAAMQVSSDLLNAFESEDLRKSQGTSNSISGSLAVGYTWCTKFTRHVYKPIAGDDWANNLPIIRYTDVLLLEAEAINATSGPNATAIKYVNAVRSRAGLPALSEAQTASKDAFLSAIKRERRSEFMFEGTRWFDLVRWGDMVSTYKAFFAQSDEGNGRYVSNVNENRAIFAIPQDEMNTYDNTDILWQNPGY